MKQKQKQVNKQEIEQKVKEKIKTFVDIQRTIKVLDKKSIDLLNEIIDLKRNIKDGYNYDDLLREQELRPYQEKIKNLLNYDGLTDYTKRLQSQEMLSNADVSLIASLPKPLLKEEIQNKISKLVFHKKITRDDLIKAEPRRIYKLIGLHKEQTEAEEFLILDFCYGINSLLNRIKANKDMFENNKYRSKLKENYLVFKEEMGKLLNEEAEK